MSQSNMTSDAIITRLSPAKINLFLHIIGKRTDGYHNLQTVFRLLDWGDYLHFLPANLLSTTDYIHTNRLEAHTDSEALYLSELTESSKVLALSTTIQQQAATLCSQLVTLTGAEAITDSLANNLIIKAAQALLMNAISLKQLPTKLQQVRITLDKRLPMGAGLGGGSSNAATTLLVLNELWQLSFSNAQLRVIGATLGADVPIFIFGQDAIAMGIGERLTPIHMPNQQYLLLTPSAHVNTAQLFAHPQLRRDINELTSATIHEQSEHYTQALCAPYHNVFTPVVDSLTPAVRQALQYLYCLEIQALGTARMTGSGSAVFLPLDASITDNTQLLADWVAHAPCPAYIVNNLQTAI